MQTPPLGNYILQENRRCEHLRKVSNYANSFYETYKPIVDIYNNLGRTIQSMENSKPEPPLQITFGMKGTPEISPVPLKLPKTTTKEIGWFSTMPEFSYSECLKEKHGCKPHGMSIEVLYFTQP